MCAFVRLMKRASPRSIKRVASSGPRLEVLEDRCLPSISGNLLVNPGAESGGFAPWTTGGAFTFFRTGTNANLGSHGIGATEGVAWFRANGTPVPPEAVPGGYWTGFIEQQVDVRSFNLANGDGTVTYGGDSFSVTDRPDGLGANAVYGVVFLDAGLTPLGSNDSGFVVPEFSQSSPSYRHDYRRTVGVPAQTAFIQFRATAFDGTAYNTRHGFDDLSLQLTVPEYDIRMVSAQLQAGNAVQFAYETAGNPGTFEVGLYRSADATFDSADTLINTFPVTPNMFVLPNLPTNPAQPYLFVVADPPTEQSAIGRVAEINETNNAALVRPATPEVLGNYLQATFSDANIKVKDVGVRTIEEQAELMLKSDLKHPHKLLDTYRNKQTGVVAGYAIAMVNYLDSQVSPGGSIRRDILNGPDSQLRRATESATIQHFMSLIQQALDQRSFVSKHLSGYALDITIPERYQESILRLIQDFGGVVETEPHGTGSHWHISYRP